MIPSSLGYGLLVRWGAIALFLALIAGGLVKCGYDRGRASELGAHAETKAQHRATLQRIADLTAEAARKAQATRAAVRRDIKTAEAAYNRGRTDGLDSLNDTLSGLRAGTLQLRRDLARQCPGAAGVPSAGAAAGGGDGSGSAGLSVADAEFLVRESARADDAVRELTLCQAYATAVSTPRE